MSSLHESTSQDLEQTIIEDEFRSWDEILQTKKRQPYGIFDRVFRFAIDRRDDPQSQVTVDECWAISLRADQTLEDYLDIKDPSVLKSEQEERWILIYVKPENPYSPHVVKKDVYENELYFIDTQAIYISNFGRAFEQAWQTIIGTSKYYRENNPIFSVLKQNPHEQVLESADYDPFARRFSEPLLPLQGKTLERLLFLRTSVAQGRILTSPFN